MAPPGRVFQKGSELLGKVKDYYFGKKGVCETSIAIVCVCANNRNSPLECVHLSSKTHLSHVLEYALTWHFQNQSAR